MRTISTAQEAVLSSPGRKADLKVSIKPAGGSWTVLSALNGYDWPVNVEYGGQIDAYVQDAIISIWHGRGKLRMSPLMAGSRLNSENGGTYAILLNPGAEVKIESSLIAPDTTTQTGDWMTVFEGYIENVSFAQNPIRVACRDKGALLDRFIETEAVYPDDNKSEEKVETLIQQILDAVYGASVIDLYSENGTAGTPWNASDSPDWYIKQYIQKKQTVQQALMVFANQLAWQLGYKWNADSSAFQLHLYDPGMAKRARGTITHTGQPSATESVTLDGTTVSEPGDWSIGSTVLATAQSIAAALDGVSGGSSWALDATKAVGTMTFTGQPSASETFVIGSTTFTEGTDWDVEATLRETLESIVTAVNASDETVTAFMRGGTQVKVKYDTKGSAGNSITFTESLTNATFDGSGNLGGSATGRDVRTICEWDTPGTAGDAIVFTETLTNATIDGGGTLGGTVAGSDASVDRTFTSAEYYALKRLDIDRTNVRNKVKIAWGDDPDNQDSVTVEDSDSQTLYGVRYCEIGLGASNQIDTESEARTYGNGVLDALKDADLAHDVDMPYFPFVETGDYYTFSADANGVYYDTAQTIAVMGFRHTLTSDGKARTSLRCSGKPRSGHKRWLRLEARGGVNEPNSDFQGDAPIITSIGAGMASMEIVLLSPYEMTPVLKNWAGVRVYISTSTGFTPSSTTLYKTVGTQTRIVLTGLTPGETYYVRVAFVAKRKSSNGTQTIESSYSPEISVQTQYTSPYHLDQNRYKDALFENADFGIQTIADTLPDGWSFDTLAGYDLGIFDTDTWLENTIHQTGNTSIKQQYISGTSNSNRMAVESGFAPATNGSPLSFDSAFYWTGTTPGTGFFQIYVKMYDKDKSYLAATLLKNVTFSAVSSGTWITVRDNGTISNSSCRYIKGRVMAQFDVAGSADMIVYTDRAVVRTGTHRSRAYPSSNKTITTGTWTRVDGNTEDYDLGSNYDNVTNYQFTAPADGTYRFTGMGVIDTLNNADYAALRFNLNSGSTYYTGGHVTTDQGGAGAAKAYPSHTIELSLSSGDTVEMEVWHNKGSNATLLLGTGSTAFTGKQLEI